MNYFEKKQEEFFDLSIDDTARNYLTEMIKWTRFIGIAGAILNGLLIILLCLGLLSLQNASTLYGVDPNAYQNGLVGFTVFFIIILLSIYPLIAILQFSKYTKSGLATANQEMLNRGLASLKGLFRYSGILLIVWLAICLLSFLMGILASVV